MEKTVFEEIAEVIEQDKKHDEEFTLELRALVRKYYPYNVGHEIAVTFPRNFKIKLSDTFKV